MDAGLTFDDKGLITAVVQDRLTGQVRMVGWMNREALQRTLESGRATFFSRSRQVLWEKGETSGNALHVREVLADCDADTLLLMTEPVGPTCHTGRPACFFRRVLPDGALQELPLDGVPFLQELERSIEERKSSAASQSYTKSLLEGGAAKIGAKMREEAGELAEALAHETNERVASEGADVVYHLLVGLALRGLSFRDVVLALARRAGVSGHVEKASRRSS